jgi:hypothetical protein
MRSKIAENILIETPPHVAEKVSSYADEPVKGYQKK